MFDHLEVAIQDFINGKVDIPVLRTGLEVRINEPDEYIALEVRDPVSDRITIGNTGPATGQMTLNVAVKRTQERGVKAEYETVRKYSRQLIDLFHNDFEGLELPYNVGDETGSYYVDMCTSLQQDYSYEQPDLVFSELTFELKL